jgi:hypothetical protein
MLRMLAVAAAASLCGLGCGAGGRVEPLDLRGCPSAADGVRATDVIGKPPPAGYDIDPGDKQRLEQIADQFKATLRDSWRGYDARVLVRHKKRNGTAVMVINSDDETTDGSELIRGAEAGARQAGQKAEPLTIAGKEGRMLQTSDGAYIAMAPTGRCAVVLLLADRAELVRDAADVIPAQ